MSENPNDSLSMANIATIKRYAPPNQRNRSLGRRKSGGDRFERANNIYMNDGDKNQVAVSRNIPIGDHGDAGSSNINIENPRQRLILLEGCCRSDAFQLMNDRWAAAMKSYNNPSVDIADKPVMYTGNDAVAWGSFRLPHQMDFLADLRRAMRNASSGT